MYFGTGHCGNENPDCHLAACSGSGRSGGSCLACHRQADLRSSARRLDAAGALLWTHQGGAHRQRPAELTATMSTGDSASMGRCNERCAPPVLAQDRSLTLRPFIASPAACSPRAPNNLRAALLGISADHSPTARCIGQCVGSGAWGPSRRTPASAVVRTRACDFARNRRLAHTQTSFGCVSRRLLPELSASPSACQGCHA